MALCAECREFLRWNADIERFVCDYCDVVSTKEQIVLPIPNRSFNAILTCFGFLYILFEKIEAAVENVCRIAKSLIIPKEPTSVVPKQTHFHWFVHNLPKLFERFDGKVVILSSGKEVIGWSQMHRWMQDLPARSKNQEKN